MIRCEIDDLSVHALVNSGKLHDLNLHTLCKQYPLIANTFNNI